MFCHWMLPYIVDRYRDIIQSCACYYLHLWEMHTCVTWLLDVLHCYWVCYTANGCVACVLGVLLDVVAQQMGVLNYY